MKKISVAADKRRILAQLRVNFQNMPDDPDEVAELVPHLAAQLSAVVTSLNTGDCRPAELMAGLSLFGPIRARTPIVPNGKGKRKLRAV